MEPVKSLFLADTTAKAMHGLAHKFGQKIYEQLAAFLRSALRSPQSSPACRLSEHVCVSEVEIDHHALNIAFSHFRGTFVILALWNRKEISMEQLEKDADVLAHVDLRSFGLLMDTRLFERNLPERLDRAVELYCRPRIQFNPVVTPSFVQDDLVEVFSERIKLIPTRIWASSEARQNLREVLDNAARSPQVIQRGDQRFLVVEESALPTMIGRKNAVELYREFFEERAPIEPFEGVPGTPPGRLADLN